MLTEILMESLMSMDDDTLDSVLESCSDEELEIIDIAVESFLSPKDKKDIDAIDSIKNADSTSSKNKLRSIMMRTNNPEVLKKAANADVVDATTKPKIRDKIIDMLGNASMRAFDRSVEMMGNPKVAAKLAKMQDRAGDMMADPRVQSNMQKMQNKISSAMKDPKIQSTLGKLQANADRIQNDSTAMGRKMLQQMNMINQQQLTNQINQQMIQDQINQMNSMQNMGMF